MKEKKENKVYSGIIPWGPWSPRYGREYIYEGEILNGEPHGYGTIYQASDTGYRGSEAKVASGRWVHGRLVDSDADRHRYDDLSDEELRDIMHDRL